MFLNHFHMSQHPFSEKPPIDFLLKDSRFSEALSRLAFFQKEGQIALILGHTGVGKSSLLRCFTRSLPQNRCQPLYLSLTSISPNALLRSIVIKLGETPRFSKDRLFLQIVEKIQKIESETLIIVDEAHLLLSESLTDLRLLSSCGFESNLPLKIILSAQQSLASLLKQSVHADLVHRISLRCTLHPLSAAQTAAYIDHRLRLSKASDKIFDQEAKSLIHDYAGGIPRQINNIATACLIKAASQDNQIIDETLVNETMAEFHLP